MLEVYYNDFKKGLDFLLELDKQRLKDQGHYASGRLDRSLENVIKINNDGLIAEFMMLDYGIDLDQGVKAENVNYSLDELEQWVRIVKPELDLKETKQVTYKIWVKHQQEGIPTKGSLKFSKTGERLNWIKRTNEYLGSNFEKVFEELFSTCFQATLNIIDDLGDEQL